MPIVRLKVRIGPETIKHMETSFDKRLEPWPRAIPKEQEVNALIDTGASVSIIDISKLEEMRLPVRGYCKINGFDSLDDGGKVKVYPNYEVGLSLFGLAGGNPIISIREGQIVGHQLANARFNALIGMDVLRHCHFHLDGPNDCFELTAPQPFVEEFSSISKEEWDSAERNR